MKVVSSRKFFLTYSRHSFGWSNILSSDVPNEVILTCPSNRCYCQHHGLHLEGRQIPLSVFVCIDGHVLGLYLRRIRVQNAKYQDLDTMRHDGTMWYRDELCGLWLKWNKYFSLEESTREETTITSVFINSICFITYVLWARVFV